MRVSQTPALYPLVAFGGFVSSTSAFVFLADWRLGFVPVVLWLVLGSICAEIAIRRQLRSFKETGNDVDRSGAIFCVNDVQGRRTARSLGSVAWAVTGASSIRGQTAIHFPNTGGIQ